MPPKPAHWLLAGVLALVLAGLLWTPHGPGAQEFRAQALAAPSWAHPLGVDGLGRDQLSRVWRGTAHTAVMALAASAATLAGAGLLLAVARSLPRAPGQALDLAVSAWVAVPTIFSALVLIVFLAPSPATLVLAAAVGNVPLAYRQLRVAYLEQRDAPYAEASRALGANRWQFFRRTLWPNLWPDVQALGRLCFALAALELAGLAFLGLIGDPDFAELGAILRQNQPALARAPWLVVFPGAALSGLLLLVHLTAPRRRAL